MNKTVKNKWLKALRSGEYKQGKNRLNKGGCFCCLGVLTDLYNKEFNKKDCGLDGNNEVLSNPVMQWSELSSDDPRIQNSAGDLSWISTHNDQGIPFPQIADLIEEQL